MPSDNPLNQFNESREPQNEEKVDEQRLDPQLVASPSFQRQIGDIVFTLIPEVPRLRELYLNWESLTIEDKILVDEYVKTNSNGVELYKPLVDALKHWSIVQETQGAPGCDPGMVTLTGHPKIETALTSAVFTLECLVTKLQNGSCSDLIESCSPTRLTSSLRSVYDEKDRGDSTLDGLYQSCYSKRSLSLDDIPKLLTRKGSLFSL